MENKVPADYLKEGYGRLLLREMDGSYSAEILEFPGCFAQGDTPTEAISNLDKAAESWITVAMAQGHEIPKPASTHGYSGRFPLRLPKSLHRAAAMRAQNDGSSLNQCFVAAIAAWVGASNLYQITAGKLSNMAKLHAQPSINLYLSTHVHADDFVQVKTEKTTGAYHAFSRFETEDTKEVVNG